MKGTINNKIELDYLVNHIDNLKLITKENKNIRYKYEITKIMAKRTVQQNKYLWFINDVFGEHLGYTADEMHYSVLLFLRTSKKFGKDGKERKIVAKTSKMNKEDLIKYIEKLKDYAIKEENCYIPDADKIPISEYEKRGLY